MGVYHLENLEQKSGQTLTYFHNKGEKYNRIKKNKWIAWHLIPVRDVIFQPKNKN